MKKLSLLAVLGLFLSATAAANVIILQDGKTMTYDQGTKISLSGETSARVLYDGVLISVPKGQKVQINKAKDGNILVFGKKLEGVEIAGEKVSSKGNAVFSVSPSTKKVSLIKGASIVDTEQGSGKETKKEQAKATTKPSKQSKKEQANMPVFPTVSEYVNEVTTQQAAQNVEDPVTSQYSPR